MPEILLTRHKTRAIKWRAVDSKEFWTGLKFPNVE